jgi:hypothetical protein
LTVEPAAALMSYRISMLHVGLRASIASVTALPSGETVTELTFSSFSSWCLEPYCLLRFSD